MPIRDNFARRLTNAASMVHSRLRKRAEDRMNKNLDALIPSDLGAEERAFVKRMAATTVSTPPFFASFDLSDGSRRTPN